RRMIAGVSLALPVAWVIVVAPIGEPARRVRAKISLARGGGLTGGAGGVFFRGGEYAPGDVANFAGCDAIAHRLDYRRDCFTFAHLPRVGGVNLLGLGEGDAVFCLAVWRIFLLIFFRIRFFQNF